MTFPVIQILEITSGQLSKNLGVKECTFQICINCEVHMCF